jgi:Leucine-rich repeat (LRR) protein
MYFEISSIFVKIDSKKYCNNKMWKAMQKANAINYRASAKRQKTTISSVEYSVGKINTDFDNAVRLFPKPMEFIFKYNEQEYNADIFSVYKQCKVIQRKVKFDSKESYTWDLSHYISEEDSIVVIECLIRYLHTGGTTINEKNLLELWSLSDILDIDNLSFDIAETVIKHMDKFDLSDILRTVINFFPKLKPQFVEYLKTLDNEYGYNMHIENSSDENDYEPIYNANFSVDILKLQLEIGLLDNIQTLNLNLSAAPPKLTLPDAIGGLTSLLSLNLENNQLESLPNIFGGLTSLKILYLNNTQLESLPDTIGGLESLEVLYLMNNKLASLPDTIGGLTSLQLWYLDDNQLTSLPDTIGGLTSLKILYLENNQLTSLPDTIGGLESLRNLNLINNQLTSLPDTIGGLESLEILNLKNNQLTSLPDTIGGLESLRNLNLINNQLTSLPDTIGGLTNVTIITR